MLILKAYLYLKRCCTKKRFDKRSVLFKTDEGVLVSQARMSTGENLLISILHSLKILYDKRALHHDARPYIVFLDEIELALHSSALRRLVLFLKDISESLGLTIFFSTHSIELLREIRPQIFIICSIMLTTRFLLQIRATLHMQQEICIVMMGTEMI